MNFSYTIRDSSRYVRERPIFDIFKVQTFRQSGVYTMDISFKKVGHIHNEQSNRLTMKKYIFIIDPDVRFKLTRLLFQGQGYKSCGVDHCPNPEYLGGFRSLLASEAPPDYTRQKDLTLLVYSFHPGPFLPGNTGFSLLTSPVIAST